MHMLFLNCLVIRLILKMDAALSVKTMCNSPIVLLCNWEINVLPFSLHGFPAPFWRRFPARPLALSQFLLRAVRSLAKIGVLRQHFLLASPVGAVVSAAFRGHRQISHADGHAVFKVQRAKRQQKSRHKTDQLCLRFFWKVMLVGYVTAESQDVQPRRAGTNM